MDLGFINKMKHSPLKNYAVPGLTSWLIGDAGPNGCVRLFECAREHQECIIPHSHRFDFHCLVLDGSVRNVLWKTRKVAMPDDPFWRDRELCQSSVIFYEGFPGQYKEGAKEVVSVERESLTYKAGDEYGMNAEQIHSIYFSKGARVLFFEGKPKHLGSIVLEPFIDGEVIPTFKVEPWMFKRATTPT